MRQTAYLSLGSNVGDRQQHLRDALRALGKIGVVSAISSFYETEPVEYTQQPWFVNCAAALETYQSPNQLLVDILKIEQAMGRHREATVAKGPRPIDIDILLFGNSVVETSSLTIPHPAMLERRFVLEPLAEIAAEVHHPVVKRTIRELRDALPRGQAVRRISANAEP